MGNRVAKHLHCWIFRLQNFLFTFVKCFRFMCVNDGQQTRFRIQQILFLMYSLLSSAFFSFTLLSFYQCFVLNTSFYNLFWNLEQKRDTNCASLTDATSDKWQMTNDKRFSGNSPQNSEPSLFCQKLDKIHKK